MEMFYREKSGNEVNSLEMEKSEEIKERKEIIEKNRYFIKYASFRIVSLLSYYIYQEIM